MRQPGHRSRGLIAVACHCRGLGPWWGIRAVLSLVLGLGLVSSAGGSETQAAVPSLAAAERNTAEKPQLLLLGFSTEKGLYDPELRDSLLDYLRDLNRFIVLRPELADDGSGLRCLAESCFARIIEKYPSVDQLVGGGIFPEFKGDTTRYKVQVFLYATNKPGSMYSGKNRLLVRNTLMATADRNEALPLMQTELKNMLGQLYPLHHNKLTPIFPGDTPCSMSDFWQTFSSGAGAGLAYSSVFALGAMAGKEGQTKSLPVHDQPSVSRTGRFDLKLDLYRGLAGGTLAMGAGLSAFSAVSMALRKPWGQQLPSCRDKRYSKIRAGLLGTFSGIFLSSVVATVMLFVPQGCYSVPGNNIPTGPCLPMPNVVFSSVSAGISLGAGLLTWFWPF